MSNESHSVLMPPPAREGGLIKFPKRNIDAEEHEFKAPLAPAPIVDKPRGVSMLGLDKLAAAKKKEKETMQVKKETDEEPTSKRSKVYSYKDDVQAIENDDSSDRRRRDDAEKDRDKDHKRQYRDRDDKYQTNTPHRLYHEGMKHSQGDRDHHQKKGIYASTSGNKSGSGQKKSTWDHKRQRWEEETPRSRTSDNYIKTPNTRRLETPSRSGWEEDERNDNRKRSTWDMNTPRTGSKHGSDKCTHLFIYIFFLTFLEILK